MDLNEETKRQRPVDIVYNKNDSSVSSFTSYLTATLDSRGIKQFHGLQLFLVIFSIGYPFSAACLENLTKVLDLSHCDKDSYEVVPVFYGVSRLAVKQQSGKLCDAFTELGRSYPADQVTKWRGALAKTAELRGHEYNDESSDEFQFIEEIAQDVFEKLYPTEEIGTYKRQLEIEDLLCKQQWGVRTLGILGEPGIGKTTLVIAVYRGMSSGYDDYCIIKNFYKKYTERRLEPLSDKFFHATPVEEFDLNNPNVEPPSQRQKRVLVVLDDVRDARDVESFLGAVNSLGPGSLVIITSRDKQVLKQCQVNEIYELNGLNDKDALKLFTRYSFGNGVVEQEFMDLSRRVVKRYKGNPAILISSAEKLKGKDQTEVKSALREIGHEKDDKHGILGGENTKSILGKRSTGYVDQRFKSNGLMVSHMEHSPPMQFFLQKFHYQLYKVLGRGGYYESFSRLKRISLENLQTVVEVEELPKAGCLGKIDLRDCKNLESKPGVTDKLKRLTVRNYSGYSEIKPDPRDVWTFIELNPDGTVKREIVYETTQYSKSVRQKSNINVLTTNTQPYFWCGSLFFY